MRFNPRAFQNAQLAADRPAVAAVSNDAREESSSSIEGPASSISVFIAAFGRPDVNKVTVPDGAIAVTLCLKFYDSAPQVDHFDYHCGLGCPAFLVLLAKKQSQTEALARKALSLCPELQNLDWQWRSERYAGGHGNYLISSPVKLPETVASAITVRHTFGGHAVTAPFWEIEFSRQRELWPHRHYGKQPLPDSLVSSKSTSPQQPVTAAWQLNDKLAGVEIHFSRRPDDAALAPLRADRAWRYSGHSKCWYARKSPETIAFAKSFTEQFNESMGH